MRVFFYPSNFRAINNDYVRLFLEELKRKGFNVVNFNTHKRNMDVFWLFLYLFNLDAIILNWPEDIIYRPLGKIQFRLLSTALQLAGILKIRIVWVVHNKTAHLKKYNAFQQRLRKKLIKSASTLVVHSREGYTFLEEHGAEKNKILYFPHPPYTYTNPFENEKKEIDILIWGNISPYKKIDEFLKNYLYHQFNYKLVILGDTTDLEYKSRIKQLIQASSAIQWVEKYPAVEEILQYSNRAKTVVYPYSDNTVLSSGGLVLSLNTTAIAIGPDSANFKDLQHQHLCYTFKSTEELMQEIEAILQMPEAIYQKKISDKKLAYIDYCNMYSWTHFMDKIFSRS